MVGFSASSRSSVAAASIGVGAHQRRPGDQGGQQAERESADPEERRIAEQLVRRGQPADLVEVPLMVEQAAWVCTTPLGALVEPDVYTMASGSEPSTSSSIAVQERRVDGVGAVGTPARSDRNTAQLRCGGAEQPVAHDIGVRQHLGQPLHIVVRAKDAALNRMPTSLWTSCSRSSGR